MASVAQKKIRTTGLFEGWRLIILGSCTSKAKSASLIRRLNSATSGLNVLLVMVPISVRDVILATLYDS